MAIEWCPRLQYYIRTTRRGKTQKQYNVLHQRGTALQSADELACPGRSTYLCRPGVVGGGGHRGEFALQVGLDCCAHGKDC